MLITILCLLFVAAAIKVLYKIVILMSDDDDCDEVFWQDKYLDRLEKRCRKK